MTSNEREMIRKRDKLYYNKINGAIPEGYNMHHLWYSNEYNPESFVIITNEEHMRIHNQHIPSGKSYDYNKWKLEYDRNYYNEHKDNWKTHSKEYREANAERIKASHKRDIEERREIIKFFNITRKMWEKELTPEVRAFMRETYRAINNRG